MKLSRIFSDIKNAQIFGADLSIEGVTLDSREVKENYLFCALAGTDTDGRYFIQDAIDRGAVAIVAETEINLKPSITVVVLPELRKYLGQLAAEFYADPSRRLPVVAVTGTNGKTSVCDYVRQLGDRLSVPSAAIGTVGVNYQDHISPLANTTPDVLSTTAILHDLLNRECKLVAMEVSSHALVQQRVNGLLFDTSVFTNLTQDHLDYHGDMESYAKAKSQLFAHKGLKTCIINNDDPAAVQMIKEISSSAVNVIRYSLTDSKANAYFSDIQIQDQGYQANLHIDGEQLLFRTTLIGEFNLYNLLAAILVIHHQGFSLQAVVEKCADIQPVAGRVQSVPNPYGISAIVDYAHTPDALERLLSTLRNTKKNKLYLVFGCGGDRDKTKRPLMGSIAEKYADFCWVTSDNPRSESPMQICEEITQDMHEQAYEIVTDRQSAIWQAINHANEQDVVVVAGKGHEKYQLIKGERLAFDDVAMLQNAIVARGCHA